ncbi:MAG TPA: UPF0182 family protein [Acidimicrobiales bacterium]|nr:UPF0182 family protein [Acidimicrobiales bacterium]
MRMPTDLPRRRRGAASPKGRVGLIAIIGILFLLLTSLRGLAVFWTDYLWFQEVEFESVWRGVLGAKVFLFFVFTGAFFAMVWANLVIADRLAPKGPSRLDDVVARYRDVVGSRAGMIRLGVALLLALMVGGGAASQWQNWLLFRNGVDFGTADAQFDRDVGFYVFRLPFISFLVNWLFLALLTTALVALAAHYLNGGIRVQGIAPRVTSAVKAHLSVLLGFMAVVKAVGYYFQRFELNFSTRGVVHGAAFTDVHAQLPAINLLLFISLAAAVLFLVNIRRQGWVLPVLAVGLWAFISIVVGTLYPAFVQKFRVEPNEPQRERPYIERNIAATREAMGIGAIKLTDFAYKENLNASAIAANQETVDNLRLWDPQFVRQTYQRLQEFRGYYRFNDLDVDRYAVDGRQTPTLVSARELDTGELPTQSWVNQHLQYTHGFGSILSPANTATQDGKPNFLVSDVPPRGKPEITQPRIYYGEATNEYAVVRTEQPEIDFVRTQGGGDETTTYNGTGGVELSSVFRRGALALRFGEINFLTSGLLTPESRAIFRRNIHERVEAAAPFLRYDGDPYPVIHKGRTVWIQDAYTVTDRYPMAQRGSGDRLPEQSGLHVPFNYVRNSVKVVTDAYTGDMTFYIVDADDPIIQTYSRIFPDLFTPGEKVDDELRAHFRYPEDLFKVQTSAIGRYHITDPLEFYNAGDAWNVAQDPGSGSPEFASTTVPAGPAGGPVPVLPTTLEARMDPTYLLMRLPGEERASFLIMQPMVPASGADRQRNLTAFVVAKSDPTDYGELEAFVMPTGELIDGPSLADARASAEPSIAQEISLLDQRGSRVLMGNMLLVPVGESLLYMRPVYVTSQRTQLPELQRIIVVYGGKAVMRPTLTAAMAALFGGAPDKPAADPGSGATPADSDVAALLARAEQLFNDADAALRAGDLATYQAKIKEGVELVRQARAGSDQAPPPSTTTTAKPTSA